MGCTLAPHSETSDPPPSASLRPKQVTVERISAAKIVVSVEFSETPPGLAQQIRSPDGGTMDVPGSLHLAFYITAPHLGSPTAYEKKGINIDSITGEWAAWQDNLTPSGDTDRQVPLSVSNSGRIVRLEVDLTGQELLLGRGPFTPTVLVDSYMTTPPTRDLVGGDMRWFQPSICMWDNAVTRDGPSGETTVSQAAPPAVPPSTGSHVPKPTSTPGFPADSVVCPQRYGPTGAYTASASGNDHTSCEFAEEVRIAYADMSQPGSFQHLIVNSPVTNTSIDMTCGPAVGGFIVCRGGNDAVVYLN
jgi:hypothetical protein